MRTLLISGAAADRDAVQATASDDHLVEWARDGRAARTLMGKERFDVVVIDWALAAPTAQDTIRAIRASDLDTHTYVIAVMNSPSPLAIAAAFQTGADDIVRRPLVREELQGRIGALDRIRRWASKVLSANNGVHDWSSGTNITALRAWTEADRAIGGDLQGVLGREMSLLADAAAEDGGVCAEIPLTLAAEGTDVCLIVGVGEASLGQLSEIVFGQVMDEAALKDVMRELANTAGGAFKRAAEAEGVALTTGLPSDLTIAQRAERRGAVVRDFTMAVAECGVRIQCRLVLRARSLERLPPNKLAEGMVLARDLMSDNGALLVSSGTRLTEATVRKLAQLLRPTTVVEIARAA